MFGVHLGRTSLNLSWNSTGLWQWHPDIDSVLFSAKSSNPLISKFHPQALVKAVVFLPLPSPKTLGLGLGHFASKKTAIRGAYFYTSFFHSQSLTPVLQRFGVDIILYPSSCVTMHGYYWSPSHFWWRLKLPPGHCFFIIRLLPWGPEKRRPAPHAACDGNIRGCFKVPFHGNFGDGLLLDCLPTSKIRVLTCLTVFLFPRISWVY